MECKKPAIRAARVSDFHAIGEDTGGYDACAYVIEHDGKVIGIGGLVYADLVHAFSKFLPECDKFKRFKVKLLYLVYGLARESGQDVYMVADDIITTSTGLAEHFLLEKVSDCEGSRGIYVCRQQAR